jgi:hypothetical protein
MKGRRGRPSLFGHSAEPAPSPQAAPPAMPAPATPSAEEIELVTQLRQLAQLQQEGILTEAEFAAKKAELLVTQN